MDMEDEGDMESHFGLNGHRRTWRDPGFVVQGWATSSGRGWCRVAWEGGGARGLIGSRFGCPRLGLLDSRTNKIQ